MQALTIYQQRGHAVESEHPISAVLCNHAGDVLERIGAPMKTTWRSAAKPFQLEANLEILPGKLWGTLDDSALAVGAASHNGEAIHVAQVQKLLSHFELSESELQCGSHWPVHLPTKERMLALGQPCRAVHNNCSGKHAFMLAASQSLGAPSNYLDPSHPVQQRIELNIAKRTHSPLLPSVTDGCGVPCFVLPLRGMAAAWASLGEEMNHQERPLGRIGVAMTNAPHLVSGTDRLDSGVAQFRTSPLLTKVGAGGLICGALPGRDLGFAIKVRTGVGEMRPVATWAVLNQWFPGILSEEGLTPWLGIKNVAGAEVGLRIPQWSPS